MKAVVVPLYVSDPSLYPIVTRSLDSLTSLGIHPITVDDASPLKHGFPVVCWNERNGGFTAAVNLGLSYYHRHYLAYGDIVVIMNDDIIMTEECMDRFKTLKGLQIASPADTASSPDDRFGSCWAMTREVYELLGPLNEDYKHFFSDLDYYNRAKEAGVEITKWRDIVLEHPESSTYKTLDKDKLLAEDKEKWQKNQLA